MSDPDDLLARADRFQQLLEARDAASLEDVLHPDYALVLVQPTAAEMPRATWLATLEQYVVHGYEVHERRVDVHGDVAAVIQRATQHATAFGEDRSGVFVITDLWRRGDDGSWRLWKRHSTPLSAGPMPGV